VILHLSPSERLDGELAQLCRERGIEAGIHPHRSQVGAQAPANTWEWWAMLGRFRVHGYAPSREAARLDLRAGLRGLGVLE
jgi:hypothetical protein